MKIKVAHYHFDNEDEAARVYDAKAKELGYLTRNFPEQP